jgi:GalNAc-alpha-(1->4)-GalNAc-alpha-(1->3)-diNAcBac-PP-undecaprenol alpha-1,4-N-acetyl-D-galactosaminyltransferase
MKILFFISSLRAGGAERVASLLCNYWANIDNKNNNEEREEKEEKIEVGLLSLDLPENDFYHINNKIKRYYTDYYCVNNKNNILKRLYFNLIRILRVRNTINIVKPDVIISFMDIQNMVVLVANLFTGIPVVISERAYPPYYNDGNLFDWLRKKIYSLSQVFVAQVNEVAIWARKFLKQTKIVVIPNPLDSKIFESIIEAEVKAHERKNYILAVGRLCKLKGFDLLIEAYYKCYKDYPEWRLLIIGEGDDRVELEAKINKLGLHEQVKLIGQVINPGEYYKIAKIFVLSSRTEGFPNVLLEAMAHGLAVISFNCKTGPADIIKNGENGLLIPAEDVGALAEALKKLMSDDLLRQKISGEAFEVRDQYKIDIIAKKWLSILRTEINARKK